ncbi:helix-turn-helix transcriptional regulator [Polymorphum gilvum]|uniref:Transcriptional regulator, LuxR family n=1 Tax=Polymorphum gilvum (strain LMG 25793 / CGMCC 1.9160 / SL003B-26A1) TaxID=991905 RepID=F2IYA8_POLGS|nr:LuxR family transcriptional regulator [Polymorphum gilvum]ADZ71720.1 Transcriptional regulator, LuxR family [Polymorphum gilvum SL003B-26A1]
MTLRISAQTQDRLIDSLYAALGAQADWSAAAEALEAALAAEVLLLDFGPDGRHSARYCPRAQAEPLLVCLSRALAPSGKSVLAHLLRDAPLERTLTLRELAFPDGQDSDGEPARRADGLLASVLRSERRKALLAILRPEGGPFGLAETAFARRIIRHIANGLRLSDHAEQARAASEALHLLVRNLEERAILIDRQRRVVAATPAGHQAMAASDLFDTKSGRLVAQPKEVDDVLAEVLAAIAAPDSGLAGPRKSPPPERRGEAVFEGADRRRCRMVFRTVETAGEPLVHIQVRDARPIHRDVRDALRALYGLSRSEARLAYYLAATGSLAETLETLSVTRNTGKTHLRRIYEKTGTRSQVELCQMIAGLSGLY